jgi:hypothetical protein
MANKVFGDLTIKRGMFAEVRSDRGLRVATITVNETLDNNAYSWQKLQNNTASLDVNLPAANTLQLVGWAVIIENNALSTFSLVVKDSTGAIIKTIVAPAAGSIRAYEFVCQDISTAAGVWYTVSMEDTAVQAASRYAYDFNATNNWGDASAGNFTLTASGVDHTRGLNPSVMVYETAGPVQTMVDLDLRYNGTTGDVSLVVPETPNCRFAGRVVIL